MTLKQREKIRLGLVCAQDPRDIRSWSGTLNHMFQKLSEAFDVQIFTLKLPIWIKIYLRLYGWLIRAFTGKWYDRNHTQVESRFFSKSHSQKINEVDVILALVASTQIAHLKITKPVIYLSDSTYPQLENYYHAFTRIWDRSRQMGRLIERNAIKNAQHLVFSSKWAADFAMEHYNLMQKAVSVVPFGGNLPDHFERIAKRKEEDIFKILFIGVNWERKGGDIVLATFEELLAKGHKVHLTICGSRPPRDPKCTTVFPFLDKHDKNDLKQLLDIFKESHLLFLPTRADCTPIVFNEAAMYGLPIISTNTGGVSSLVVNEQNGFCMEINASNTHYVDAIEKLLTNETYRQRLAINSRNMYENILNWEHWLQRMKDIILENIQDEV